MAEVGETAAGCWIAPRDKVVAIGAAAALIDRFVAEMRFASTGDHYGDKEMVFATIRMQIVERNLPQIFTLWQFNESGWRTAWPTGTRGGS